MTVLWGWRYLATLSRKLLPKIFGVFSTSCAAVTSLIADPVGHGDILPAHHERLSEREAIAPACSGIADIHPINRDIARGDPLVAIRHPRGIDQPDRKL